MRLFLTIGWKLCTALIAVWMAWMSFAPASVAERAALGTDFTRFNLVQMRLARSMMTVAPDATVAGFSAATDIPTEMMEMHLRAKAEGRDFLASSVGAGGSDEAAEVASPPPGEVMPNRRTEAGGALFVRP